jgi:signal transduction histidine kinase
MRRTILCILWSTLYVFAQPQTVPFSDKGAWKAEVLDIGPGRALVYDYVVDDFDRDGIDEIGLLRQHPDVGLGIAAYEQDDRDFTFGQLVDLLPPGNLDQLGLHHHFYPIQNHPIYRYALLYTGKDHTLIYLLDGRFAVATMLTAPRGYDQSGTGQWNGYASLVGLWDYNKDGQSDVWVRLNSGADAKPRALLCIDVKSNSILFRRDFAPMPNNFKIVNLNNGNDVKLVGKLTGAGHGEFFGSFKRDESYLARFDIQGNLIQSWEHPGVNTLIQYCLNDVNHDSYLDICAVFWAKTAASPLPTNSIRIIDGATLTDLHEHSAGTEQKYKEIIPLKNSSPHSCFITHDRATRLELLSFHSQESRFIVDRQLSGIGSVSERMVAFDINQDGWDEITFITKDQKQIYVLDQKFNVLAKIQHNGYALWAKARQANSFKGASLYFLDDQQLKRADLPTANLFPPPALDLTSLGLSFKLGRTSFIVTVLFLLGGAFGAFMVTSRRRQVSSLIDSTAVAAMLLTPKGKIVWTNGAMLHFIERDRKLKGQNLETVLKNRKAEAILPHYQIFSQAKQTHYNHGLQIRDDQGRQDILIEFSRVNRRIQLIILENSPANTEQLQVWATMAQRLVHKAKTPLSSMLLSVQRLQRDMDKESKEKERYAPYLENMIAEIERIRMTTNEFLRFSRLRPGTPHPVRINDLMSNICERARRTHFGVAHLQCDPLKEDHRILVDADQIKEAFMNFIDNSVQASKNKTINILISCSLQTHVFPDMNKMAIEISDDGVGIPRDKFEDIFKPGYTSKENGSGMGLVIAKALIEQNDGELFISSRENIGTTVTVLFPLLKSTSDGETNS